MSRIKSAVFIFILTVVFGIKIVLNENEFISFNSLIVDSIQRKKTQLNVLI